jgi:hypothetical protein
MPLHKPHCPVHHCPTVCSDLQLPEVALAGMFPLCRCRGTSPRHHSGLWGAVGSEVIAERMFVGLRTMTN